MQPPTARAPGEVVVLRELWDGRIWSARAAIVVCDEPDERRLFTPAVTTILTASDERGRELRLPADTWSLRPNARLAWNVLSFAWPEEPYAVLAMWDEGWRFRMWYVNVEDPLRATSLGFDTTECLLDVVIEPDLSSWRWKDQDELQQALSRGLFTPERAAGFHDAADRGRRRVMDRRPPFDREWSDWRPDPSWPVPDLPPGWDAAP